MKDPRIYGLMAEFDTVDTVIAAAQRVHGAGYRKVDAYSPFPLEAPARSGAAPWASRCARRFVLSRW